MTAGQAMKIWQKLLHEDDEACCMNSHEYLINKQATPKPDDLVCERELAWRTYVRLRDNNPLFPFHKDQLN